MRQTFGNYIEFSNPLDPEKVPQMFRQTYMPLISSIKRRGGKPLPETMRIYILDAIPDLPGRFGIKIDADFTKKSVLEEINDELEAGSEGSGKSD